MARDAGAQRMAAGACAAMTPDDTMTVRAMRTADDIVTLIIGTMESVWPDADLSAAKRATFEYLVGRIHSALKEQAAESAQHAVGLTRD